MQSVSRLCLGGYTLFRVSVTHAHYLTGYIDKVDVDATPTVRVGSQVMATVNPKQRGGSLYVGPLLYCIVGENEENFTDVVTAHSDGSLTLSFSPYPDTITKSKDIVITFKVWNHISSLSVKRSLGIVGKFFIQFLMHLQQLVLPCSIWRLWKSGTQVCSV